MHPAPAEPDLGGTEPPSRSIVGIRVDATSYGDATSRVMAWADEGTARYVCVANVHMAMEAADDPAFADIVNGADLVTPDGVPLVWALRALGVEAASRVYGPTLTLHVCEAAERRGIPVGFFGSDPDTLARLVDNLGEAYPKLAIPYSYSPPFRSLSPEEDEEIVRDIRSSGARILFVGLGCPKQERWMAAHQERLPLVQLGVGAAFDFHAGTLRQAPGALQAMGLEWAFRLAMEPKRLFGRYLRHNPRFVARFAAQWARERRP